MPIKVRGIGLDKFWTDKYMLLLMNFVGQTLDGTSAIASFTRKVALVPSLTAKLLISTDCIVLEKMDIIVSKGKAIVRTYSDIAILMAAWYTKQRVDMPVKSHNVVTIQAGETALIPIVHHLAKHN